jgi:transcriptional regulator with XRE-family HTH domain
VKPFSEKLRYLIAIQTALPAPKHIGERLRLARLQAGWTGKDLAGFLDVNEMTICNWERSGIIYQIKHREKVALFLGDFHSI